MNISQNILDALDDEDIRELEELEDGSTVYEIGSLVDNDEEDIGPFYRNLAGNLVNEDALKKLSSYLLDAIEKDISASEKWMKDRNKTKEYMGFGVEDPKDSPFKEASRTYDTTLPTSVIKSYANIRGDILPNTGPVGYIINGESTEQLEEKGDKVRDFLNNYLLRIDKGYYPDYEKSLLNLIFDGCACRKVYYDKLLKRPISRFIAAEDFIIDGDCNSIDDSNRITHVLRLSKREILLNQQNGIYRNIPLPYLKSAELSDDLTNKSFNDKEGIDLSVYEKRSLFPIYECHVYLNLDDFNNNLNNDEYSIPLPFIVILDPNSKEILSVRRNWEEDDKDKNRINYFVLYNYITGFGIRGLGLSQMLGSNAISSTTILRVLIDAGKFQNLPGGLRKKGFKTQETSIIVGPGEFPEVDTGGEDLRDVFLPLPYSGPSQALGDLLERISTQTRELGAAGELGMLDSKEAISPSTLILALEKNNKIQNIISESIHCSFNKELQLIYDIFKKTMSDDFQQTINGKQITIDDFAEEIEIIPISNPSSNSTIHKIVKAQAIMESAMMSPEIHNMYEVFKLNYKAQGISENEIDKILKPDPADEEIEQVLPLDPVSENLNILNNKPVQAAKWQNHAAHKMVHGMFAEQNPDLQAEIMAHIQEHNAQEYLVNMEHLLGYELPSLEELQDPEIQNEIAMALAEKLNQSSEENTPPAPIDPNELLLADIRQKEEETAMKERVANLRAETDVFKAQLDFEKQKAKTESEEDIAKLRAETELIKQGIIDETEQI